MPPPAKVDLLPEDVRAELDRRIIENGFGGYVALSEWLESKGYQIKKSALHAHGKGLEEWMRDVRTSTQAAILINEIAPDDEGQRSQMILTMIQTGVFDVLKAIKEIERANPEDTIALGVLYGKLARAMSELARADISQRKYAAEVRSKVKAAAESASGIAKRGGLSEAAAAEIRAAILGIQK